MTVNRDIDMLHGGLWKKILIYALPLALTGILQQLFNAADVAVVGRFTGKEAMAAVGANSPIVSLLVNFFIGISLGANVVIAHAIGRRDHGEAVRTAHTSVIFAVLAGAAVLAVGELFVTPVLRWTGVPASVMADAAVYLRLYLVGMPVILLYNFEAAIFRSQGDAQTPLVALALSGVLNVVLNLIFVAGLGRGVGGVAVATVIANAVASIFLTMRLTREDAGIRLRRSELHVDRISLKKMLHIGVPSGLQDAMFCIANIIIQAAINSLGPTIMAAASAAFSVEIAAYYMLNAFNQACTTFTSQNYGAKQPERCRRTFWLCLAEGYLLSGGMAIAILAGLRPILSLFSTNPAVIRYGVVLTDYVYVSYLYTAWLEVGSGYLRGFGLSFMPALVSIVGICVFRMFWIAEIFRRSPTFRTIMLIYPVSLGVTSLAIALIVFILRPSRKIVTESAE